MPLAALVWVLAAGLPALLAGLGAGCGDGTTGGPDAGAEIPNKNLVLLPPGQEVGLTYNSRIALRVRYETAFGEVIRSAGVRFALVATNPGESTAGATLSSSSARTDSAGIAQVDLVTGAQEARFRVSVDAQDAPTQHFFVSVSQGGFARLHVTPGHAGWRPRSSFERVELRLYSARFVTCANLDLDLPQPSAFPVRELEGFDTAATFQNVNAGQPHTVVAWGWVPGSPVASAAGCMDLDGAQLPPSRVELPLLVEDRALSLRDAPVRAVMDLSLVAQAVAQAGATRAWDVLACGAGPGQLLLDCALDAVAQDGALDCLITGTGAQNALVQAAEARRGLPDAGGCRPDVDGTGMPSLDRRLTDAASAGGWPAGEELAALLQARAAALGSFELDSALTLLAPGAAGHRLVRARARAGAGVYELELGATSRPVIEQTQVAARVDGDHLELGEHGFTIRYGAFAASAFATLGLAPAGLPPDADAVGRALVGALVDPGTGTSGCLALSVLVCAAIGEAPGCLEQACQSATPALDQELAAWWRAVQGTGQDLVLAGAGRLHDADGDLAVESVGRDDQGRAGGQWSGSMRLAGGADLPIVGEL